MLLCLVFICMSFVVVFKRVCLIITYSHSIMRGMKIFRVNELMNFIRVPTKTTTITTATNYYHSNIYRRKCKEKFHLRRPTNHKKAQKNSWPIIYLTYACCELSSATHILRPHILYAYSFIACIGNFAATCSNKYPFKFVAGSQIYFAWTIIIILLFIVSFCIFRADSFKIEWMLKQCKTKTKINIFFYCLLQYKSIIIFSNNLQSHFQVANWCSSIGGLSQMWLLSIYTILTRTLIYVYCSKMIRYTKIRDEQEKKKLKQQLLFRIVNMLNW